MRVLKAKNPSANEALYVVLDHVTSFLVSGGSGAYAVYATVIGSSSPVMIKDGYTSRDDADAALNAFLDVSEVESI
jgi:hypothetical protein